MPSGTVRVRGNLLLRVSGIKPQKGTSMGILNTRGAKRDWRAQSVGLLRRVFPDRELMLRTDGRMTFVRLSRNVQVGIAAVMLLMGAWLAFGTIRYVLHEEIMAAKDDQIANARLAYRSLLVEVAEYQDKFNAITGDLKENHALMLGLVEQNANLEQNLNSVKSRLHLTEKERARIVVTREGLKEELNVIDTKMQALANHNFSLKGNLDTVSSDLQTAMAERNQARYESAGVKRQLKALEGRLADLNRSEEDTVQRLTKRTTGYIKSMEKIIGLTGIKVARLLPHSKGLPNGKGGPFIAAAENNHAAARLKANLNTLELRLDRSGALEEVMGRLPLTAPLDSFYITSKFGKRRDPINKKWAMHYGLDMGSPYKSAVYATAPGRVVFAGWKGRYGKLVVIDHGSGLKTRFGHLNKITVKKGQRVAFREKIGLLGSTGRSTGPHLHYEVVFRGKSRNPRNFIKAGRYVFQG